MSNNDTTWTTIFSTTNGTGGVKTFAVSRTARYLRLYGTKRATQFGYSIFEFDVYGLTTTAPLSGGNGNGGDGKCPWVGSTAPVARRVQQVLTTMDRSEEVTLLSGDGTSGYIGQVPAIPKLCIRAINMEDGPDGVGDGKGGVTAFPDGENAAATWDPALIEQEGAAIGAEFAGKGVNVSLGPTTNLVRDPRWGRTYETYGEDPYLAGQITAAEVEGIQSRGVMAMVKHVAAYDQEQYPNGDNNETVSQKALEELYLAPFQAAIEQSAPAAFMCSYALVNSEGSCQNADMLQNGLDTQADSGGFVISDWGAAGNVVADAEGGMDIAMPFSAASGVTAALTAGTLSQATLNAVVGRILTQMFAFGLFDNPAARLPLRHRHQRGAPADGAEARRGGHGAAEEQRPPAAQPEDDRVDRGDRHRRRRRRRVRRRRQRQGHQREHGLAAHRHPGRGRAERQGHLHPGRRQRHHRYPEGGRRRPGRHRRDHLRQLAGGRGERPDHARPVQRGRNDDRGRGRRQPATPSW